MRGRPVTPPGGLNIGSYDRQVKEQAAQKKKDYKEMLDQVRGILDDWVDICTAHRMCQL